MYLKNQDINNQAFMTSVSRLESAFKKKALWQIIHNTHQLKTTHPNSHSWDNGIYLPFVYWDSIFRENFSKISSRENNIDILNDIDRTALLISLINIGSWKYSMGCYFIGPELYPYSNPNEINTIISNTLWDNFHEWAICIPTPGLNLNNRQIANIFVSKSLYNSQGNKKYLLINFQFTDQNFCNEISPYAIIDVSKANTLTNALITTGGLNKLAPDNILHLIGTCVALLNIIFCKTGSIESNYVGIPAPSYKNVPTNTKILPNGQTRIKHLAPSSIRQWFVGADILAQRDKVARANASKHAVIEWFLENGSPNLKVKLVDF